MNSIPFNLTEFLFDKRLTINELSVITGNTRTGIWQMSKRGTVKMSFLRKLESSFGDCSKYMNAESKTTDSVIHGQLRA